MITLSMIVKNEEKYLQQCFNSVKDIVDEIVVVDTGSTDNTIEIAKNNKAKVLSFNWINDFAAARNYALQNSNGDWILYLDADERLTAKSKLEIQKSTKLKTKTGYQCTVTNINDLNGTPAKMSYVRLFANTKEICFEGKVHEQIELSLRKNGYQIRQSNIEILHVGYNISNEKIKEKAQRNLELLLNEFANNKTSYYAFQLGQTFGILSDKENAIKYFQFALKDQNMKSEYKSLAYRYIAVDYAEKNSLLLAEDFISRSLQCDSEQPLALLVASKIKSNLAKHVEAEKFCKKAYEVNSKLLHDNKNTAQTIFLDEETFLYQALSIAIQSKSKNLFNFFYNKLFSKSEINGNEKRNTELDFFNHLLNNKEMTSKQLEKFISTISERNLELIMSLIGSYKHNEIKIQLLELLKEKFKSNCLILNEYGLLLLNEKKLNKANEIFEISYQANNENPSTVFYLISSYIHTNQIEKILPIINFSEKKFCNYPEIINRINTVKQKIIALK